MKIDLNDIEKAIRPFVEAKIHNPNRSMSQDTSRTINVLGSDIRQLKHLHEYIIKFIKEHKTYEKAHRIKKSIQAIVNSTGPTKRNL